MKVYPNNDGSYDVVNLNKVLFHVEEGRPLKLIGRVNEKWQHPRKRLNTIPLSVLRWEGEIISKKL
jgi:hypothetical protein